MLTFNSVMNYIFGTRFKRGGYVPDVGTELGDKLTAEYAAQRAEAINRAADEHVAKVNGWIAEQQAAGVFPKPRLVRRVYASPKGHLTYAWMCFVEYGVRDDRIMFRHRDPVAAYREWAWRYAETIMRLKGLLPPKIETRYSWSDGTPSRGGN